MRPNLSLEHIASTLAALGTIALVGCGGAEPVAQTPVESVQVAPPAAPVGPAAAVVAAPAVPTTPALGVAASATGTPAPTTGVSAPATAVVAATPATPAKPKAPPAKKGSNGQASCGRTSRRHCAPGRGTRRREDRRFRSG